MAKIDQSEIIGSSAYRLITAAVGLFFTSIMMGILIFAELTLGAIVVAAIFGLLGIDAIVSAYRKTASLLSRIGPLP
jgi:hypothetical protein